jgi:hypothetical protein
MKHETKGIRAVTEQGSLGAGGGDSEGGFVYSLRNKFIVNESGLRNWEGERKDRKRRMYRKRK